jgi:hypothetical protein
MDTPFLEVFTAEYRDVTEPSNAGIVGEIVRGQHGKYALNGVVTHNALNLDVASLEVAYALTPNAGAMDCRDGVALDTRVMQLSN